MKVCVFGAGAVGSYLGARLSRTYDDVVLVGRGDHLKAIQENGIAVTTPDEEFRVKVKAYDSVNSVGKCDLVISSLKSHQIADAALDIKSLMGENTLLLPILNGVPWWYKFGEGKVGLKSSDPDGRIEQILGHGNVLGSVVYIGLTVHKPGHIKKFAGYNKFFLGDPLGKNRHLPVVDMMKNGGLNAEVAENIFYHVWSKMLNNVSANTVSVLTESYTDDLINNPDIAKLLVDIMLELFAVSESVGIKLHEKPEDRLEGLRRFGKFKTSMLQDFEKGKKLELEPIMGAMVEVAGMNNVPIPFSKAIYDLVKQKMISKELAN